MNHIIISRHAVIYLTIPSRRGNTIGTQYERCIYSIAVLKYHTARRWYDIRTCKGFFALLETINVIQLPTILVCTFGTIPFQHCQLRPSGL